MKTAADRTRELLGPADPARDLTEWPAQLPAATLIARAENTPDWGHFRAPRIARRRILAGAVATAAAATAGTFAARQALGPAAAPSAAGADPTMASSQVPVDPAAPAPAMNGAVLAPAAFEIDTDPPRAAQFLLDLAGALAASVWERGTGEWTVTQVRQSGGPAKISPEGFIVTLARETWTWSAAGEEPLVRERLTDAEYPDQESRNYYVDGPGAGSFQLPQLSAPPPGVSRLPSGPDALADLEANGYGYAPIAAEQITTAGSARELRRRLLSTLAKQSEWVWRGRVVDRAGRAGVAISADADELRRVIILNPETGEVLSVEEVRRDPKAREQWRQLTAYRLILVVDRVERAGRLPG